ncbi:MAG: flagellin, partial [Selenomonadaceae bacterium]|nr:flagellin [Selenomonadaceae bacterium]
CGQFVSFKFDDTITNANSEYYDSPDGSELYVIGVSDLTNASDIPQFLMDGVKNAIGRPSTASPAANAVALANTGHPIYLYMDTNVTPNEIYVHKPTTPTLVMYNGTIGELVSQGGMKPYQDFYIQGDTKSSLETRLQLPNTTLDMLFPDRKSRFQVDPAPSDYPTEWPKDIQELSDYDRKYYSEKYHLDNDEAIRREKWLDEIWPYPRRGATASASCVLTRKDANKFLEDIDQALKYLLHAATNLGAQCQRMDAMGENVVTGNENTQASESAIRDADMAKEMVTYTKNNVLSQTAQSMLSQANQNSSGILDILQ